MLETPELPTNPSANDHLEGLRRIQAKLSTHLHRAQQTQMDDADHHRLPSSFDIGDRVWLLRRHIKTSRSCDKLLYQWLGPFVIDGKINDVNFRLDLAPQLWLYLISIVPS